MAPKHKSTPSQNPLRSGASSSSDPIPSFIQFHDKNAWKDFSENFCRRGIHLEHHVVLSDFSDTDLPTFVDEGFIRNVQLVYKTPWTFRPQIYKLPIQAYNLTRYVQNMNIS